MKPLLRKVKEKGIKVVTNAGGVNPEACARALSAIAAEQGIELSIALVLGDNVMGHVSVCMNISRNSAVKYSFEHVLAPRQLPSRYHGLATSESEQQQLFLFQFDEVKSQGVTDIDTGQPLPSTIHSMNAYLGYEYCDSIAKNNNMSLLSTFPSGHFQ